MQLVRLALRHPWTVVVGVVALVSVWWFVRERQKIDIFPSLNLPVIYVCQPYGGMDPAQMEGLLTNYYEYHFLYIGGIHHVESRNVQGVALMKLVFHPGTNMAQAMAETISYVNRSRAFMPPGTVPPFVMRFDTGSVPVGYLVLSSDKRTLGEIQDLALFRIRPMFASVPGVSAPPPFGGSQRTLVVRVDPDRLRSYRISPEEVVEALVQGNAISPSGNVRLGTEYPIVPINSLVRTPEELGGIPVRTGDGGSVYLRDLGVAQDASDLTTGYALFNGRRAVYILVTKRAEASTVDVVQNVRAALPAMQEAMAPHDIRVSFELDQSTYVTRAIEGLALEALLGAVLTGLMVLVFLRDWRSALVVVLNIPLALGASQIALWLTGHTINLMTLGGLALAVGILVDEATVELENIHARLAEGHGVARAVRLGNAQTALPRFLAMLCILAVFLPALFMTGAAQGLFLPLALAVGFAMAASYLLSSTLVPVLAVWLLKPHRVAHRAAVGGEPAPARGPYRGLLGLLVKLRWLLVPAYLAGSLALVWQLGRPLGIEVFPRVETDKFRLRFRAPDGTHFEETEKIALDVLDFTAQKVGRENVETTLGYVGAIPSSYPINAVYQWMRGPEEGVLWVSLKRHSGVDVAKLKEDLRRELPQRWPKTSFSFEPADIVNEVMSFGSPTPIDLSVSGPNFAESRAFAERVRAELAKVPALRDLSYAQSLDYPTVEVRVDRERAGQAGVTTAEVARSLVTATSSSRFVVPLYWPDPKTGIGYQVQVEIPQAALKSVTDLEAVPVRGHDAATGLLLRDVAQVARGTMPGQFDRYNMKRQVGLTANVEGSDLRRVALEVEAAVRRAGPPPAGATLEVRGQIPTLNELMSGLTTGLGVAVLVIFLLLVANFQSVRLALTTVSTVPAVLLGVVVALRLTDTTLNIQSFMGAIMAVGVAMANAILLVSFAESRRRASGSSRTGAIEGAAARLRPVVMTSGAMIAGMLPLAWGWTEGGEQSAPLGRAVIGGLLAATLATLLILPAVFALVMGAARTASPSLDPDDPDSPWHDAAGATT